MNSAVKSPQRAQIQQLARVAFALTSIAALPGLLATLYPPVILFEGLNEGNLRQTQLGLFMLGLAGLGWWLYWTYWLELRERNRFGRIWWLVSALANGLVAVSLFSEAMKDPEWLGILVLSWLVGMALLSGWVWVLKMRS